MHCATVRYPLRIVLHLVHCVICYNAICSPRYNICIAPTSSLYATLEIYKHAIPETYPVYTPAVIAVHYDALRSATLPRRPALRSALRTATARTATRKSAPHAPGRPATAGHRGPPLAPTRRDLRRPLVSMPRSDAVSERMSARHVVIQARAGIHEVIASIPR